METEHGNHPNETGKRIKIMNRACGTCELQQTTWHLCHQILEGERKRVAPKVFSKKNGLKTKLDKRQKLTNKEDQWNKLSQFLIKYLKTKDKKKKKS